MARVNLAAEKKKLEPYWFSVEEATEEEPAVRVLLAPIGRVALRAAKRAAGEHYAEAGDLDDDNLPMELIEKAGDALSRALLMAGIIDWEGVGWDETPIPVDEDMLTIFLADPDRFEKLDAEYVHPYIQAQLEKNVSSPSANGISRVEETTAATAIPGSTAGASPTPKRKQKKAAKAAPTSATSRKPTEE
jgi:hypothetical protein